MTVPGNRRGPSPRARVGLAVRVFDELSRHLLTPLEDRPGAGDRWARGQRTVGVREYREPRHRRTGVDAYALGRMPDPTAPPPDAAPPPPPAVASVPAPTLVRAPAVVLAPRLSRVWFVAGPALVALVAALVVLASMPVNYFAIRPGSARPVEGLITIRGRPGGDDVPKAEPADDDLLFVTVTTGQPSGIQLIGDLRDHTVDVVQAELITGGQSREENRRFDLQRMTDSKDLATTVALERAGYDVDVSGGGAVITDLDPKYPAAKVLHPGDLVLQADADPVAVADDLVKVIARHLPGDVVSLVIVPLGQSTKRTVKAELTQRPNDSSRAMLGVSLETRPVFTFPFDVEIDSGRVGGPSAGLAFTLAILDRITAGDLTGDNKVAVTGTISLDGTVGPVGGVSQKTEAAIRAGATAFLVPPDELAEARRVAHGRLVVRKVSNLDQALAALKALGGDPLPPAP